MAIVTSAAKTPAAKYDGQVAAHLAKAEGRIRALDLTTGLLGLAALVLFFAVVMAVCDNTLNLSAGTRGMALLVFLVGTGAYLWFAVLQPLRRQVNPYYAALKVESLIPGAKNSIINWVDLHGANLPASIRAAVGLKAARDAGKADVERAISGKRAGWAGAIAAGALALFLLAFVLLGRGPFLSLMARAFAPFSERAVATRCTIEIVRPEGGDATLPVGRSFTVIAEVSGLKKTEKPRFQFREGLDDKEQVERLMDFEQGTGWTLTLPPVDVRNGFWYRIAAGDAVTPEHHVRVRAAPSITHVLTTYRFRPYVGRADEVRHERELKALRGTQVILKARTNRELKDARLEWEGKTTSIPATLVQGEPEAFEAQLVLKDEGKYRLAFTSTEGEPGIDTAWFTVTPVPDKPPQVELTKPAADVKLPANGLLELEATASDDIGVKSIRLQSRVVGGAKLKARPYRGEDGLKLDKGGYPQEVTYKDFLDLAKVQSEDGKPVELRPGMELEYWLEASDACDFDKPNVTESRRYHVQIVEPEKDAAQQQKERERAERDQKKHQQDQDKKLKEENQKREKDAKEQEEANNEEREKDKQAAPRDNPPSKPKEDKQDSVKDQKPDPKPEDGKGRPGDDGGNPDNRKPNNGLSKEEQEKADRLKDALDRKDEGDNGGDNPGDKTGEKPGDKTGEKPGDKTGEKPGDKTGEKPGDKTGEKPGDKTGEKPGDKTGEKPGDKTGEKPGDKTGEKPGDKTGEKPGDKTGEKPGDKTGEKPGDKTGEKPGDKTGEKPGDKTGEKPGDKTGEKPGDKTGEKPGDKTGEKPGDKTGEKPGDKTGEKPGDKTGEKPGDKTGEKPGDKTGEKPGDKTGEKPGDKTGEKPGDKTGEKPGDKTGEKPGDKTGEKPGDKTGEKPGDKTGEKPGDKTGEKPGDKTGEKPGDKTGEKPGDKTGEKPGDKTGEKPGDKTGEKPGDKTGEKPGDKTGEKPGDKTGEKPGDKTGEKPGDKTGEKPGDKTGEKPGDKGSTSKAPPKDSSGNDPGAGGKPGDRGSASGAANPSLSGKGGKPKSSRPSMLQLEEFKKKVDRKVLQDAKMSEEDYQRFLKAYEEAARRQKDQPRSDGPLDPKVGGPLPSIGKKSVAPEDRPADDIGGDNRKLPPPGYRDAYREYTKKLSPSGEKK